MTVVALQGKRQALNDGYSRFKKHTHFNLVCSKRWPSAFDFGFQTQPEALVTAISMTSTLMQFLLITDHQIHDTVKVINVNLLILLFCNVTKLETLNTSKGKQMPNMIEIPTASDYFGLDCDIVLLDN